MGLDEDGLEEKNLIEETLQNHTFYQAWFFYPMFKAVQEKAENEYLRILTSGSITSCPSFELFPLFPAFGNS